MHSCISYREKKEKGGVLFSMSELPAGLLRGTLSLSDFAPCQSFISDSSSSPASGHDHSMPGADCAP